MPEIEVKRKHYHDGGGVVGDKWAMGKDSTVAVCSCGKFVRYTFAGDEWAGGWYWIRLNPWYRWKWRRDLRAYRAKAGAS